MRRITALVAIGVLLVASCSSGAATPPPVPTVAATPTGAPSATVLPTPTATARPTPVPTAAPTAAPTPTLTPPPRPTATPSPTAAPTATPAPLRGQALLDKAKGFPRAVLFRTVIEALARRGEPIERVVALAQNYEMILAKALDEEVPGLQRGAPYLQAIKARYPEKIVLDHFLWEGRNPLTAQPAVYPGHWLLLNGTTLAADVGRADGVMQVADSGVLREGEGVQITALDASGRPDYTKVEQVRVVSVAAGRATVERGAFGSAALEFKAGQARIAAHAWVKYSTNEIWKYNFCLESPRDTQGRSLGEALAHTLAEYLKPGGVLAGIDGYQFDVARFYAASAGQGTRRLDCNNDGAPEGGYTNGVSSYGLGAVSFTRTLRGLVGEQIFLISEATGDSSDRDVVYANGIENESFPDLHAWEHFGAAYQRYQYWTQQARQPRLSYLQLKETSEAFNRCPEQNRGGNWRYRLALAAALLGDGYFAYLPIDEDEATCGYIDPTLNLAYAELDEFKAGRENRWNYLGKPLEGPRRLDLIGQAPNLLSNGGFESDLSGATLVVQGTSRATMVRDESQAGQGRASLRATIAALDTDPADTKIRVELGTFAVQAAKEYTLRFKVRADPKYGAQDAGYAGIPRRIGVSATVAGKALPAGVPQAMVLDVMADSTWREYSLSFLATVDDPRASIGFLLGKESGEVWLDDVRLALGAGDVFVRRFEGGVVLVNGSSQSVSFDLRTLFPGMTLRRIDGTQDPGVNSGAAVTGVVGLPGRDALILLSK